MLDVEITVVKTEDQFKQALALRTQVFVVEQQVPEELEIDEHDETTSTVHLLATDSDGHPVAVARIRPYDDQTIKVERVAVVQSHRGTGLGRQLMAFIEAHAQQSGFRGLKLNAQLQARGFYNRLGYLAEGETFLDAGIEHVAMKKEIAAD